MIIDANDRILFTGDSITDCDRDRANADSLGSGYAALTAAHLQARLASPALKIWNRGISGNRVRDLLGRVEADLLALKPTVVSILIGINDTWRRFDSGNETGAAAFERDYRALLGKNHRRAEGARGAARALSAARAGGPFCLARGSQSQDRRDAPARDRVRRGAAAIGRPLRPGRHTSAARVLGPGRRPPLRRGPRADRRDVAGKCGTALGQSRGRACILTA